MAAATWSYVPHYFCLDDILCTQEKVPCKLAFKLPRLGFLDPSSTEEDLAEGTSMQLPLWLATALGSQRPQVVVVDIPRPYKEAYRDIFKAGALVVDLHRLGPFFYEVGLYVLDFNPSDADEIAASLVQTFKDRFRRLMDVSQNSLKGDFGALTATLDQLEKGLFAAGQVGLGNLCDWLRRDTGRIGKARLVEQHRKRKFTEMEAS